MINVPLASFVPTKLTGRSPLELTKFFGFTLTTTRPHDYINVENFPTIKKSTVATCYIYLPLGNVLKPFWGNTHHSPSDTHLQILANPLHKERCAGCYSGLPLHPPLWNIWMTCTRPDTLKLQTWHENWFLISHDEKF